MITPEENYAVEPLDEDPRFAGHTILENYFLYFWKPILGNDAGDVYELLKSYCFGHKETCYPSRKTLSHILGIKRGRLTDLFEILERFYFIKRETYLENSRNTRSVFRVARVPPLIKDSYFEEIKNRERREWLRKRHEKLLEKMEIESPERFNKSGGLKQSGVPGDDPVVNDLTPTKGEKQGGGPLGPPPSGGGDPIGPPGGPSGPPGWLQRAINKTNRTKRSKEELLRVPENVPHYFLDPQNRQGAVVVFSGKGIFNFSGLPKIFPFSREDIEGAAERISYLEFQYRLSPPKNPQSLLFSFRKNPSAIIKPAGFDKALENLLFPPSSRGPEKEEQLKRFQNAEQQFEKLPPGEKEPFLTEARKKAPFDNPVVVHSLAVDLYEASRKPP